MNAIVSAFVSNVNNRFDNSINIYYNLGKTLLKSDVPKILFVDEDMFNLIGNEYDKTNKTDAYLYKYAGHLTNFQINSTNHSKDTIKFIKI